MSFNNEGVAGPDKLKKLNNNADSNFSDEDYKMWSDVGNKTTQTPTIETPKEIMEALKEKMWRRSHSLKSVETLENAIKSFEKYLVSRNITYQQSIQNPIEILDGYTSWLDKNHAASTTRTYLNFAKKALKFLGAKIDSEEFKERVTLPKKRPFQDDKVTKDQIRRIILGLNHLGLKTLLMLMKDTQARPTELLGLRVSDINLSYDPPYLNIAAERAKNDLPRELFFTPETKGLLISYIKKKDKQAGDFLYLNSIDPLDEVAVQEEIETVNGTMRTTLRNLLAGHEFADMNEKVRQHGTMQRYKLHIYSFKKFAFTVMADTLGEIAARAIKGDREYVLTYYRKNREERAADYNKVTPKLSVFSNDVEPTAKEVIEAKIRSMDGDELAKLQEFLKAAKA